MVNECSLLRFHHLIHIQGKIEAACLKGGDTVMERITADFLFQERL